MFYLSHKVILLSKKPLLINQILLLFMYLNKLLSQAMSTHMNVCLGGTFDGIHAGHRLLFEEALKICTHRLVVGVTDTNLITHKVLWELIAPVEQRCHEVEKYLKELNSRLTYQVVPIRDVYGPTLEDKDLECIVVSEETLSGAHKINQARSDKGWPQLKVHMINLLAMENNGTKISSSLIRRDKLGTILRPPSPNDDIPKRPYLIGLTGGIASGKTSIGKYLESLGFGYINYDLLGHKTYGVIGSQTYNQVVETFGRSILNETTNEIERSRLGKIVFGDKDKLNKLNEIVWPAIYELVDAEINILKDKHDVIVLESALLIESKQSRRVHQVWTTFVPPEEAIKRQMQSRGLSKEEAENRLRSQLDNSSRINKSNAVFCTLWEPEFTHQQVRKCVTELKEKYLLS